MESAKTLCLNEGEYPPLNVSGVIQTLAHIVTSHLRVYSGRKAKFLQLTNTTLN